MPYVPQTARTRAAKNPMTPGELNYAITTLVDTWILENNGLSYLAINTAIGVLECAKLELYRRIAIPYEDAKQRENGDVYTCDKDTPKA